VLRIGGQAGTLSTAIDVDAQGAGEISLAADDASRFVLMMCERPAADYDPDLAAWKPADYRYTIQYGLFGECRDGVIDDCGRWADAWSWSAQWDLAGGRV
jgi:hypothetical protein